MDDNMQGGEGRLGGAVTGAAGHELQLALELGDGEPLGPEAADLDLDATWMIGAGLIGAGGLRTEAVGVVHHVLCPRTEVEALGHHVAAEMGGEDHRRRNRQIYERLRAGHGHLRQLRQLPGSWRADLIALEGDYPNCAELIGHIRAMGALAEIGDGVIRLDPILLDGEPGSGKSTIVEHLAEIISGGFQRVAMSAAESGAQIGGSASSWANSQTGVVFDTLVMGRYSNPLVLLDELDKAPLSPGDRYSPVGPLYQLLESAMAREFRDLSLPVLALDASRITWMATSNDGGVIPVPLLQRMQRFAIEQPSAEAAIRVVGSVMTRLSMVEPVLARFWLAEDATKRLAAHSPRIMRSLIRVACGRAVEQRRLKVIADDVPLADIQRRRIGFCK